MRFEVGVVIVFVATEDWVVESGGGSTSSGGREEKRRCDRCALKGE